MFYRFSLINMTNQQDQFLNYSKKRNNNNNNNKPKRVAPKNIETKSSVNNYNSGVKTVYATGPVYKFDTDPNIVVKVPSYLEFENKPKQVSVKKEQQESKNNLTTLLRQACYPSHDITKMVKDFKTKRKVDPKTGTLVPNLQPILISHLDESNNNRYKELSSQKFQKEVSDYYAKYNINVTFINDRDEELWKIYLYPQ